MLELPVPEHNHHLTQVLALLAFGAQSKADYPAARAAVCQAFGLAGDQSDDPILYAMLLLNAGRLEEARSVLQEVALAVPAKIPSIYAVFACVFKYFNAGLPIDALAGFAIEPMLQLYQTYPTLPTVQLAMFDMLLYLGLPDECEQLLSQVDGRAFQQEADELATLRARIAQQENACRLSIVLITYQRPELLRHTLRSLRAALHETDVEIVVGVNDDWPQTLQVLQEAEVDVVLSNPSNTGIEFYKQVFATARGEYLLEIDDDVEHFPPGFDRQIVQCLQQRADLGLVGHWPSGFVDARDGSPLPPAPANHVRETVAALPFGFGPVPGCCAGMRRRDYLAINGFARATLGHQSGEEPQLIRKLAVHGMFSGVIFDQGLRCYQNG